MTKLLNPFELSSIHSGYELINFFDKLVEKFKKQPPDILLECNNLNILFIKNEASFDVFGDYGKNNLLDLSGFSYGDLDSRFIGNDKIKKLYKILFKIFNSIKSDIQNNLNKLKLFNNDTILNCKYFNQGNTRVFLIDGVYKSIYKNKKRTFEKINIDHRIIESLVSKLQPYANSLHVLLFSNLKTDILDNSVTSNIFKDILNTPYTIKIKENLAITKSLKNWLKGCKNPINKKIIFNDDKVSIYNKKIYFKILNNISLEDIVGKKYLTRYKKILINSFILQLTTQAFGQILLQRLVASFKDIPGIYGVSYKNVKIIGDNLLEKYNYFNEDDQQVTSYISNPPHKTADWGQATVSNESFSKLLEAYNLEMEPHSDLYFYYIAQPRPFMPNDLELYNNIVSKLLNCKPYILVPSDKHFKFESVKQSILALGVPANQIVEYNNYKIDPNYEIYCGNDDKLLFGLTNDTKKYFKPDLKTTKIFKSISNMKPYAKRNYFIIEQLPDLKMLEFKIKNYQQFIKKYKNSDDAMKSSLLVSLYGNTNLKEIFNKVK